MAAPGFGVALHQCIGAGVEKQHLHVVAQLAQLAHGVAQAGEAGAHTHVDRHGHLGVSFLFERQRHFQHVAHGQVVDAEIAGIFENVDGQRFAGTGNASDDDQLHEGATGLRRRERGKEPLMLPQWQRLRRHGTGIFRMVGFQVAAELSGLSGSSSGVLSRLLSSGCRPRQ